MYSIKPLNCAFLLTALLGGSATAALAVDGRSPPLVLEATIPLKAVAGRIDHMAVDLNKHRLVVAELGNDTVDVIDLRTQQPMHRIEGLHEPQGVASASGVLVGANGGDVSRFSAPTLPVGSVACNAIVPRCHTGR